MSKKQDEQHRILASLVDLHAERVTQKAAIRAEVERIYESRLYDLKLREAVLMIEGYDLGISKSKLGRAIGTTDWRTVQDMLELGRSMRPEPEEIVEPYSWSELEKLPNGTLYAYLTVADAPHHTHYELGDVVFDGDGWLFIWGHATGWLPLMTDRPSAEIEAWGLANPPMEAAPS